MVKLAPVESSETLFPHVDTKDEMNLAEFPIALLTDRPPSDKTSLVYQDTIIDSSSNKTIARKLTITAPVEYGLPRGIDEDVIVALVQLTKLKNNFLSRKVRFTRTELIELLGWPYNGKSYERLTEALYRWTAATLAYENAWWVKEEKRWTSKIFHIIDDCEINDSRSTNSQHELLSSEIAWNETVFNSFVSGNLRDLDYRLYLRLEYSTSKRMFRFLDKRFYYGPTQRFDLKDFAFAHIGLSQTYAKNVAKIKEKLSPAIAELTEAGFLEPMDDSERYVKKGQVWEVVFKQKTCGIHNPPEEPATEPSPQVDELTRREVSAHSAAELVRNHPADFIPIETQIEAFDWLRERKDPRCSKSPAGYLVKSIRHNYALPEGFTSGADRQKQEEAKKEAARKAEEMRKLKSDQKAFEAHIESRIEQVWQSKTPEQRAHCEMMALSGASEADREAYHAMTHPKLKATTLKKLCNDYIRKSLMEFA
jgi:Replication initiator protein A